MKPTPATLAAFAMVPALALPASLNAQSRGAPHAVRWTGRAGQPALVEVRAVQQSAAPGIAQCHAPHATPASLRVTVVFETSGRVFWTSADSGTSQRLHCIATALRRTMALNAFGGTEMLSVRFPIAHTAW